MDDGPGYNTGMTTAFEHIRYEVDDPVATITLNRPDQLNAWTARMGHEVAAALVEAERDPAVVGIVLTGAGRGFCAGADLGMLAAVTDSESDAESRESAAAQIIDASVATPGDPGAGADLRGTYTYLMSVAKPIIAAINGPVAGMGVPVALACDLRFISSSALITTSFAQRGLIAEWGIAWQLSRLVGPAHALDLLFSARKVGAEEAVRIGLANRLVAPEELLDAARDYLVNLAENCSPTSIAVMKRQVYLDLHRGLGEAGAAAERLMVESFGRPDFQEGVQSYLQRRPPKFGRIGPEPPSY
jgi:enoyl-CoA hydratase/carnithine racemase